MQKIQCYKIIRLYILKHYKASNIHYNVKSFKETFRESLIIQCMK